MHLQAHRRKAQTMGIKNLAILMFSIIALIIFLAFFYTNIEGFVVPEGAKEGIVGGSGP